MFGYVPSGTKRQKPKQPTPRQEPGTVRQDPPTAKRPASPPNSAPVQVKRGRVVSVNASLNYIVIDYSLRKLPEPGSRVSLYRQGQKVGEALLTGPAMDSVIAADLRAGEGRVGDEVREE